MKLALKWEEASANRLTEAQARRVLSDIHEQIHGSRLATPTVADYSRQWLGRKAAETRPVTHSVYKQATLEFCAFIGEKVGQPVHYVTPAQIVAWRDAAASKATARTANNKLKIMRILFQDAWREGLIVENPAAKVEVLRSSDGSRRPFTLTELRSILRVASTEWKGMVLAGVYTGQRLKDLAGLTWSNIDLERGEIRLTTSKTGRSQVLPIAQALRTYLEQLPSSDNPRAPIFPSLHPLAMRPGGSSPMSQQFHSILVDAGIAPARQPKDKASGKGRAAARERAEVSFHSLRHTATSLLKAAGVSEAVTRDIIGHESAAISRHYTHVEDEAKRAALERLPNLTP